MARSVLTSALVQLFPGAIPGTRSVVRGDRGVATPPPQFGEGWGSNMTWDAGH